MLKDYLGSFSCLYNFSSFVSKGTSTSYLLLFSSTELLEGASRAEEQAINTKRNHRRRNYCQISAPLNLCLMSEKEIADSADGGR